MTVEIVDNGDGTKTIQVRGNDSSRFSIEGILATYDHINVKFNKTVEPNAHVGLSEVSFGNMQRFQSDRQDGVSTILEHIDPLYLQSYASRVDFTLYGIRDTDVASFARVSVGMNMRNSNGEPASFDMGTYFVTSVRPVGTDKTQITAEDVRSILDRNTVSLTITTADSIRAKLISMLTSLNVGYRVDSSVDIPPLTQIVYEDVSPMKVLTDVSSRFGIPLSVGTNGEICLLPGDPRGRLVTSSNIMRWAASESSEIKPNVYTFDDGYVYDKRTDKTLPPVKTNISNEFFVTAPDRIGMLLKIDDYVNTNSVVAETTGDLRIETGDLIRLYTRDGIITIEVTSVENRIGTSYRQQLIGLTRAIERRDT